MDESSCCSISSLAFGVVSVPDIGHSNMCVVVSYCCFNLHFPDDIWCGASFHMLICHLYIFFSEVSVKVFGPFFNGIICFLAVEKGSLIRTAEEFTDVGSEPVVCIWYIYTWYIYMYMIYIPDIYMYPVLTQSKSHPREPLIKTQW